MEKEISFNDRIKTIYRYFSRKDLGIILILAIITILSGNYGMKYILPGGGPSAFAHGFLKLPGPGAGIFVGTAFICIWLVLGLLLLKKPGTALSISIIVVVVQLILSFMAGAPNRFQILLIPVAIIIELFGFLPLERKPWKYVFPVLMGIMGIITLALMVTGNAKMGENGAAATMFPLGYAVSGILILIFAVLCYSYPAKYIIGAGVSQVFFIVYCWLFNGKQGFATWVPVTPAIPALLTYAFVCGAFMAALAYGFYLLWQSYTQEELLS